MRLVRYAYGIGRDGPAGRTGVRGGSNPWAPARVRGPTGTGTAWRTIAIRSQDGEDRLSADLSRVAAVANGKEGLDERDKTCSRFDEVDKRGMEARTGETLCLRLAASWGWSVTTVPEVCDRSSFGRLPSSDNRDAVSASSTHFSGHRFVCDECGQAG